MATDECLANRYFKAVVVMVQGNWQAFDVAARNKPCYARKSVDGATVRTAYHCVHTKNGRHPGVRLLLLPFKSCNFDSQLA
jgi:hypothetical protein